MKSLGKALGLGAVALSLAGCEKFVPNYLEGKVIEERGSLARLEKSDVSLEAQKREELEYILTVETQAGVYSMSIKNCYKHISSTKPVTLLAEAIKVGDEVRFVESRTYANHKISRFYADKLGEICSQEIELLPAQ